MSGCEVPRFFRGVGCLQVRSYVRHQAAIPATLRAVLFLGGDVLLFSLFKALCKLVGGPPKIPEIQLVLR